MAKQPVTQKSGGAGNVLYYEIASFQAGIDTRKSLLTAPAGTLRLLTNAHITQGGEIEKREAFTFWVNCPPGSLGLISVDNQAYVYLQGSSAGFYPPTETYVGVYTIVPPAGVTLTELLDYDVYNGIPFATFYGTDGVSLGVYAFYGSTYVPDALDKCSNVRTYKEKMYGIEGRYLFFSAVGDPTVWTDPPPVAGVVAHNGSGYINVGSNDSDSESLVSMEVYYDKMALFSTLSCQLWFLDPDPSLNQYYQTLRDAGTLASQSVKQYVANDVYFLGTHGIRSLRARDLTTTAAVADVGSPIDPIIQNLIHTSSETYYAQSLLSQRTGRFWMVYGNQIFILSNFASPNISAWSTYIPEFTVAHHGIIFADPYVVLRGTDNKLYRYGSGAYDSCPVSFLTPALSFDKPTTQKFYQGFDAICQAAPGSLWNIQMCFDPTVVGSLPFDQICAIDGPTMLGGRIPVSGRGTHLQIQATHQAPAPATFSKMFIHYASGETG